MTSKELTTTNWFSLSCRLGKSSEIFDFAGRCYSFSICRKNIFDYVRYTYHTYTAILKRLETSGQSDVTLNKQYQQSQIKNRPRSQSVSTNKNKSFNWFLLAVNKWCDDAKSCLFCFCVYYCFCFFYKHLSVQSLVYKIVFYCVQPLNACSLYFIHILYLERYSEDWHGLLA